MSNPPTRKSMIDRLMRLMNKMLQKLEDDMGAKDARVGEKEATVLMRMVNAMGKLIEFEAADGHRGAAEDSREIQDIRNKLLQRIDELKRN